MQPGDIPVPVFSFLGGPAEHPEQILCHLTRTTPRTHDIIGGAPRRSPMYNGGIEGVGPRYCPSVEDKVVRFADKSSHQVFEHARRHPDLHAVPGCLGRKRRHLAGPRSLRTVCCADFGLQDRCVAHD